MLFRSGAVRLGRAHHWLPHPGLAAVLALQYLAGYTQVFVYTVAAVAFVALMTSDQSVRAAPGALLRSVPRLGLTLVLAVALSAIQLISAMRLLPEMGRTSGIEYSSAARWSLQPRDVMTPLFPRAFADPEREFHEQSGEILWEKVGYVGLLLPLLAPLGVWRARHQQPDRKSTRLNSSHT